MEVPLDFIIRLTPEDLSNVPTQEYFATLVNDLFNSLSIPMQIELYSEGLLWFCQDLHHLQIVFDFITHLSLLQDQLEDDGPVWHMEIIQKNEALSEDDLELFFSNSR